MKKYILIQNDGEIETNSFELIGASTKRGESGKIGFFGSGLKYSIAYMIRNGIDFKIFSGEREVKFTTVSESLKEKTFDRICINGKPTSYTITMGPTWKEDWYVLREIYCNAIDEGACIVVKDAVGLLPSSGKTRIYIELTEKLHNVINDWDKYFSDERTPLFEFKRVYTSGLGSEDGTSVDRLYQYVKVYHKTDGSIFRRGIKVGDKSSLLYDYEFGYVDINEDRTAKHLHALDYAFSDMLGQMENEEWVKSVLRTAQNEIGSPEYLSTSWHVPDQKVSDKWLSFSKENLLVVYEISGRYSEEINQSKKEVFLLRANFAKYLKKSLPAISILGMSGQLGDTFFSIVDKTPKMEYLLKEVLSSLGDMGYSVTFDIVAAEFENEEVLGQADIKEKTIFIAKKTFDMGRRELAMTIMEENEHILSGKSDETRAFQNHIFSKWLKAMEETNGIFL